MNYKTLVEVEVEAEAERLLRIVAAARIEHDGKCGSYLHISSKTSGALRR